MLYYKKAFNINVFIGFSTVSTVHFPKPQKERYIHSGTQESFSKWRFLCTTCTNYTKEGEKMTDYNAQLIDLLNEKILRLEQDKDRQRKEINRQARRIKELEKKLNEKENATDE